MHRNLKKLTLLSSALCLLAGCSSSHLPPGPPLERITRWNTTPTYTQGTPQALLDWVKAETPTQIIHTPEDRWINHLADCMTPFIVNWEHSNLSDPDQGSILVHNVQVAGNPLLGISQHATVRIPLHSIDRVEFLVVRYHLNGLAKASGHVQLRFVFNENHRPELLTQEGKLDPIQPYLDDLILSWEAWRPTNTAWSFTEGLNAENYRLTARLYSGAQRFLNDSLRGAVWDCYPLKLPDHPDAADSILTCGLLMGDMTGRRSIWHMIESEMPPNTRNQLQTEWNAEERNQMKKRLHWSEIPEDILTEALKDADLSYHALERSCITVTLLQIETGLSRLYEEHQLGERTPIHWEAPKLPKWFDDVANGNTLAATLRAPYALLWLSGNGAILPYKSYLPLKAAGVLQTDSRGKIIIYRYEHKNNSPYGALKRNLM